MSVRHLRFRRKWESRNDHVDQLLLGLHIADAVAGLVCAARRCDLGVRNSRLPAMFDLDTRFKLGCPFEHSTALTQRVMNNFLYEVIDAIRTIPLKNCLTFRGQGVMSRSSALRYGRALDRLASNPFASLAYRISIANRGFLAEAVYWHERSACFQFVS